MEIRQVIDRKVGLDAILRDLHLRASRRHCVCAEDHHVQPARRCVIDPFCSEEPDAVQRGEVDLLGGDEFVVRFGAEIEDVVAEEGVGDGVVRQQDELRAARCQLSGYGGANAGCASLDKC